MRNLRYITAGSIVPWLVPLLAFAKAPENAADLMNRISTFVINPMIYVLFACAFVVFVWGLVQFIMNSANEEARNTGAKHILWGLIGMVIMVGVNGILGLINSTIKQIGS